MRISLIIFIFSMLFCLYASAQTAHKLLRDGNKSYSEGAFSEAELYYRKSKEKENDLKSNFNLGNATYQQERYEEAIDHFMSAAKKAENKTQESDAFYNLGNAQFNNENLDEAIESYKQSLRLNPKNKEAMYNLGMTKMIKQQMQQQEQEQQPGENSEENDENKENQEQQDQEQQQDQNQEQQDQEQQDEQQSSEESEEQSIEESAFDSTRLEKQTLDSLDAAKLLQIIQSEEQKVQEKLRKFSSNRKKPDKDW